MIGRGNMKKNIAIISFIALIIDQIIKFICIHYLKDNLIIIPGFLSLTYAENSGVAFSLLSGNKILIILISLILIFLLLYYIYNDYIKLNKKSKYKEILYGLLLGGILGNLIDRIIHGVVIDYASLNIFGYRFPIFNLADTFITITVILIFINYILENKNEHQL